MTADDVRGEDYEAAKLVPARTRVTGDPWVREHLRECLNTDHELPLPEPLASTLCICDRLRACEQRKDAEWASFVRLDDERNLAYAAGVQAARDAVAAAPLTGGWTTPDGVMHEISREQALAAIDSLRADHA